MRYCCCGFYVRWYEEVRGLNQSCQRFCALNRKGTLESHEIRIAMLLLEHKQRPPRYAGAGRKRCRKGCVRERCVRAETEGRENDGLY